MTQEEEVNGEQNKFISTPAIAGLSGAPVFAAMLFFFGLNPLNVLSAFTVGFVVVLSVFYYLNDGFSPE